MTNHKDAVNSQRKSVKTDDSHSGFQRFVFSRAAYVVKKIDTVASNRGAINNFEI